MEKKKIEWPKFEYKNQSSDDPIVVDARGSIYATNPAKAQVLLSHHMAPIIIYFDYCIPAALEDCYCLEINKDGFIVLRNYSDGDDDVLYERIGCASWHIDKELFSGWPNVEVGIVKNLKGISGRGCELISVCLRIKKKKGKTYLLTTMH
jgi:hypothetical protein